MPTTKRPVPVTSLSPVNKQPTFKASHSMSADLGESIVHDVELLESNVWKNFVDLKRTCNDFTSLENVHHPENFLSNDLTSASL